MRTAYKRAILGTTLITGTVLATTALQATRERGNPGPFVSIATAAPSTDATDSTANLLSQAFRRATNNALPGVVFIDVQSSGTAASTRVDDPLRGTPFEGLAPRVGQQPREGSGSGFIFRPDGYVLTNNHVVEGADRVTVVMQDRREYKATVVGRDPNTDIAVIKIDGRGLPVVPLANSDAVKVGDWVVALGYPLQLGATATAGIISAKGRSIGILGSESALEHYIQTDAAINPGNSGGPLVDLQGRVVGVNSAIKSPTGYYSGYGFAVPVNIAARVANDLIEHGVVRRPKLGAVLQEVSAADAAVYKLSRPTGAEIVETPAAQSPAAKAGLTLGDVIVAVNGKPVETVGDLTERLALFQPKEQVTLDYVRYGAKRTATVKLDEFETEPPRRMAAGDGQNEAVSTLGFQAVTITPRIAQQVGVDVKSGVVVSAVHPMSPAGHAALQRGHVITSVNGRKIETAEQLESMSKSLKPGDPVSLLLATPDGSNRILNFQVQN